MTPVCPFVKAARSDDVSGRKTAKTQNKTGTENEGKSKKESVDSVSVPAKCPFTQNKTGTESEGKSKKESVDSGSVPAKCPYGFDSQTFKIGPLSCLICQALLFECSKCVPCSHVFCKTCILRFNDCPLCGADIEKVEADDNLQKMVDQFIEGHARIKRSVVNTETEEVSMDNNKIIYEDVSLDRGAFMVQQAMRAFRAQNIESAKSRLHMVAEDVRDELGRKGNTPELCSQLGAVLGMLGDCSRATGDSGSAINYFEESVEFLAKLPIEDLEITHTLSVSLNKIGDLRYYDGDLQAARSYYFRSLNVRRNAVKCHPDVSSQIVDVAVSLAKVADIDRSLKNEDLAMEGFKEGLKLLENLKLKPDESVIEQRRLSVLEFLQNQITEKHPESSQVTN